MGLNPNLRRLVGNAANKYKQGGDKARKPQDGRNTIRLLIPSPTVAPWMIGEQFWVDFGVHWIKAEENGKPLAVVGDEEVFYGRPSAIVAAINRAVSEAPDEASKKLYTDWKSKKSVLIAVVDRKDGEVVPYELTPTTFGKVLDLIAMYADSNVDITDELTGLDIVITKTGKMLNTNYDVAVAPTGPSPIGVKDVWTKIPDLRAFVEQNYFRGEEQKALNLIGQIANISVPMLAAPTTSAAAVTPTAALSAPSAVVRDAPAVTAPATPAVDPLAARRAELEAQLAALQKAETTAPVTAPAPAPTPTPTLSTEDENDILAELDALAGGS